MFNIFKKSKKDKACCNIEIEEVKEDKNSCCNVKIEEVADAEDHTASKTNASSIKEN